MVDPRAASRAQLVIVPPIPPTHLGEVSINNHVDSQEGGQAGTQEVGNQNGDISRQDNRMPTIPPSFEAGTSGETSGGNACDNSVIRVASRSNTASVRGTAIRRSHEVQIEAARPDNAQTSAAPASSLRPLNTETIIDCSVHREKAPGAYPAQQSVRESMPRGQQPQSPQPQTTKTTTTTHKANQTTLYVSIYKHNDDPADTAVWKPVDNRIMNKNLNEIKSFVEQANPGIPVGAILVQFCVDDQTAEYYVFNLNAEKGKFRDRWNYLKEQIQKRRKAANGHPLYLELRMQSFETEEEAAAERRIFLEISLDDI